MRSVLLLLSLVLAATQATSRAYAQWELEESHTTASLRGIHNVGAGVAWASGTNGTVLRTEDGGYLWQTCSIPPGAEKLDFRGVQGFDENTAIVMSSGPGDQSRLYKTTDGCQTWKLLFTNPDKEGFWDAIQFVNANHFSADSADKGFGMLVGDPVDGKFTTFVTFDYGESWKRQSIQGLASEQGEGLFAASNSSLMLYGKRERAFVTGGPTHARLITQSVYGSTVHGNALLDTGESKLLRGAKPFHFSGPLEWTANNIPLASSPAAGAFSIAMKSFSTAHRQIDVVIVGGDYRLPDSPAGTAASSSEGILSPAQTLPHGYRSAVAHDEKTKTWITVGPNGTDISTDDGENWRPLTPSPTDPVDADKDWNALSLPFVVGPHGRIGRLRTIDLKAVATKKP
jgi:photosystem II stability/assembly factor-like uncharacterized protein